MYFRRTPFYQGIRGLGRLHDTNRAIILIGCHSLRAESEWKLEQGEIQCQSAVPYHWGETEITYWSRRCMLVMSKSIPAHCLV